MDRVVNTKFTDHHIKILKEGYSALVRYDTPDNYVLVPEMGIVSLIFRNSFNPTSFHTEVKQLLHIWAQASES